MTIAILHKPNIKINAPATPQVLSSSSQSNDLKVENIVAGTHDNKPQPIKIPTQQIQSSPVSVGIAAIDYSNSNGSIANLEEKLKMNFSTLSIYKQFGLEENKNIELLELAFAKSQNMKVLVAWEPWNPTEGLNQSVDYLAEISKGGLDDYLRLFAMSVKSYGNPVTIRFGHEMNGDWYSWGNQPQKYVDAYKHIHDLFLAEGVSNVTWMWSINATNQFDQLDQYYPGDNFVDVIGLDGFNFGSTQPWGWQTFSTIFKPTYDYVAIKYEKPIVIAETASSELGGNKSQWIEDMFLNELPQSFPKVKEVIWFNYLKETDWRIDSSDSSLESFKISSKS